ncbi:hypothetical protein Mal64_08830 [Pseudobythopirellula maris]|uniref:DUF1559 domain-containing protein n=1 Tax=Pseudobythopirellula maris TaxID=2527991 RepID=A0A5C5ZSH0_9BACT|nr:DUF1559 domain-containing protein [Pseudobythopirellula maris]TWT90492.1 hypothetical protein Mal64_08830 [Pseudobythopirellula maris]
MRPKHDPRTPSPEPRRINCGFTLVELLVVIAIIGILVALLLPAVQAAREAARRNQCKSQLKQLALGSLNHHDVQGFFQSGGWGWGYVGDPDFGFGEDQPGGWVFSTLPFVEEQQLYDLSGNGAIHDATGRRPDRTQLEFATEVVQSIVSITNCPTRRQPILYPRNDGAGTLRNARTPLDTSRMDYAMNSGHAYNEFPDGSAFQAGPATYASADINTYNAQVDQELKREGPNGSPLYSGISFGRSEISLRKITDGTSHTYLIGEKALPVANYSNGADRGDNETWCTGFNNDNFRKTGRLVGGEIVEATPVSDTNTAAENHGRFGSAHPGVWLAALCDGSVHAVSFDIDWQIHRDLGNRTDGNVASIDQL